MRTGNGLTNSEATLGAEWRHVSSVLLRIVGFGSRSTVQFMYDHVGFEGARWYELLPYVFLAFAYMLNDKS